MSSEFRISSNLSVNAGNLQYPGIRPTAFLDDLEATVPNGPAPGSVLVTTAGVDIDLSMFTTPGWCEIVNLSEDDGTDNYVNIGVRDVSISTFQPLVEVGPGKKAIFKLSRDLLEEFVGTGTSSQVNKVHARARSASVYVYFGVFER